MRTLFFNFSKMLWTVVLLWICGSTIFANPLEAVKTKTVNKTFSINAKEKLEIDNSYGEITIAHWNRNEVEIRVEIESKAASEKVAQANLDRINIEMTQFAQTIKARTIKAQTSSVGRNPISISVRYFVQMPAYLKAELNQIYGNINLPSSNNHDMEIDVKYGNLVAGNFVGNLDLDAKYSNVTVGNLRNADITLGYAGNVKIGDADQLDIDAKYSKLKMQKINSLQLESSYSNFTADLIDKATIEMKYGAAQIKLLKQSLEAETFSYSDLNIDQIDEHFKLLAIEASFSNIKASISSKASFSVDAEGLRFGSCKLNGFSLTKNEESERERHAKINGGKQGWIKFDGGGYSHLSIKGI